MNSNPHLISERKLIYQGTGTELKKLIKWFPMRHHTCPRCEKLEQMMNEWGPDKCYEKLDYILHYMEITARHNNILWSHRAVKTLILAAIRLSR